MTRTVTPGPGELVVDFDDFGPSRFHYFWLRENCPCAECTHATAWERIFDFTATPLEIVPADVHPGPDDLVLTWPDGHTTRYSFDWLAANRAEPAARLARKQRAQPWTPDGLDIGEVTASYDDVMGSDDALRDWLEIVERYGISLVKGVPTHDDAVLTLAERVGPIEPSHFGTTFHVRSKPNPENVAYTSHRLFPHNDLASRALLPGIQYLHCIENGATGGDSIFVDSIAIAEQLKEANPEHFEILCTERVSFTQRSTYYDVVSHDFPVLTVDRDGDVIGSRLSTALIGPIDVEPDRIDAFYRAFRHLLDLATDPANQLTFRMEAGDCQAFHNHRALHARTEFDPNSGPRHLQGCYTALDDFRSHLRLLRRRGAEYRTK